jgi:hypothetical protein
MKNRREFETDMPAEDGIPIFLEYPFQPGHETRTFLDRVSPARDAFLFVTDSRTDQEF